MLPQGIKHRPTSDTAEGQGIGCYGQVEDLCDFVHLLRQVFWGPLFGLLHTTLRFLQKIEKFDIRLVIRNKMQFQVQKKEKKTWETITRV